MLVNLNDILPSAEKNGYAAGLFNSVNLEMARGIIAAAEKMCSPVIIGTAEVLLPYGPLEELSYFLLPMAEKASVPVVVHLDHGLTEDTCRKALKLGFTSIMYDCSTDPYEINITKVAAMSELAHSYGATIEAELGHVGSNEDSAEGGLHTDDPSVLYTDPEQAGDFVNRTKVDALAVAVGSAHGAYRLPPKLDFDRIRAIRESTGIPLVLHGGSGLTGDDFRKAIEAGISKINIFTDIDAAGASAAKTALEEKESSLIHTFPGIVESVEKEVMKKMKIFGSGSNI